MARIPHRWPDEIAALRSVGGKTKVEVHLLRRFYERLSHQHETDEERAARLSRTTFGLGRSAR